MKKLFWIVMGWFGYVKPEPLTMAGIYGITSDGCYLVRGTDGVLRKSHPLYPPSRTNESQS